MSLRCLFTQCARFEIASAKELAFYQDVNNGGWNLGLGPEFDVSKSKLPSTIRLIDTGEKNFPYTVICNRCDAHIGKVGIVSGFGKLSINFSARKVLLLDSKYSVSSAASSSKWSKIVNSFPNIRKLTAMIAQDAPLIGSDTIHFHGLSEFDDMTKAGTAVSSRSNLTPRRYQWRAYFFSCLQNTLLCLPTGMGKTLIANMLMKAYHERNPKKGQVFIVPTIVLVEQQASTIERTTGLNVKRRSSEHKEDGPWSPLDICVCTPAILNQAVKLKKIDISQLSLLIFDEVHEGISPLSEYGNILSPVIKCLPTQRPRILALTASPSGVDPDMRQSISSLCVKLCAKPFMPLMNDEKNTDKGNDISCNYISIAKSPFEVAFENFVIDSVQSFALVHDFFKSNSIEIPKNVPVQNKIALLVKTSSLAVRVAQNSADVKLLQLAQWINKWIDSLDMLQIFGPRQLLKYIDADLNFVPLNESLSEILTQLSPYINRMKIQIAQLARENDVAEDSPRVTELLKQLKFHKGENQRFLIFVDRRSTAERLSRRLGDDEDIREMNPDYVVGSSNSGFSKEQQQAVLANFHSGKSKVLVATSVLEQGIDVAKCGVVVCYDGVKSLKSIIQSRGRARKKKANFIAFVSGERQRQANELTKMETSMNYALLQLMYEYKSSFEPQFAQEIEKFLESGGDNMGTPEIEEEEDVVDESDDVEINADHNVVVLRFFNFVDSDALADHISSFFTSPLDRLKITRRFVTAQFVVPDEGNDGTQIIKNISSDFDQEMSSLYRAWAEITTSSDSEIDISREHLHIDFNVLTGFHFNDYVSVCVDANYICCEEIIKMSIYKSEIVLLFGEKRITIRPVDIDETIMINDTQNSLEIFFCLRKPPSYFNQEVMAPFNFECRSFNLHLKRNKAIDVDTSVKLRNNLKFFSMHVYNVCHLRNLKFDSRGGGQGNVDPSQIEDYFMKEYLIKVWRSKHAAVLPPRLPDNVLAKFFNCSSTCDLEVLLNNTVPARFEKLLIHQVQEVKLPFEECGPPKNYSMFGRVNVMSSRKIFMPMLPIQTNRVFRFFPDPENFLLVSFTDEHGENPWRSDEIYTWFLNIMETGIQIADKLYTFLGCSNSQLREGHCWFSTLEPKQVYDKVGVFPANWTAGRKLTRLGLAFASSIETVGLDHERYLKNVAPDVEHDGVCFSDGIGRASKRLFDRIKVVLDLPQPISAFQIRVGGVKGVISVFDEQQEDVVIRKSMKKFESDHNVLEVLSYSRSLPLSLNRHVILLLSSFEVPDEVFLNLYFEQLFNCMEALTESAPSIALVKANCQVINWNLFQDHVVIQEPFFRQILLSNITQLISEVVNHAHISIKKGRILMGVLDETNTLEYGEVYVHIVEDGLDFELEGKVVVFRNPSVLPSDIRVLFAKKNSSSRLKDLYRNCLVVPSRGKASHAAECSGGDLDGDLFYVIWDELLIPPHLSPPGRDVVNCETREIENVDRASSDYNLKKFFCNFVSKNQLGVIANAHLATADKFGIDHPRCIELARYVVAETDAPRKGFTVGKIDPKLMPDEYPDYMNKPDKQCYRSATVLGRMFRQAQPILGVLLEKRPQALTQSRFNFSFDKDNVESFYSLYSFEVRKLLQAYDLQSEVDLFSGTPIWKKGYMSAFKQQHQLRETLLQDMVQFWEKWQKVFEKWRISVSNNQQQICEWYRRPKSCPKPAFSFSFLAMPFVNFESTEKKSISELIQISTMRWIYFNKMDWMNEFRERINVGIAIMNKLEGVECHFYGSSVLGLSEEYSDVDLFASDTDLLRLEQKLRIIDENAVSMKKPHACVSLTMHSLPIDVTNFIGGVKKTYALAEIFDENPGFWPALRVLIEWARTSQIVKSGGSEGLMNVVSFCHLFIYFATSSQPKLTDTQKPYSLARFSSWIESLRDSPCGVLIFEFLRMLSNRDSQGAIRWMVDPLSGESLIKSDLIEELTKKSEVAVYILAVHDGDIQKLFQFCAKTRLFRIDKRYMDPKDISDGKKMQCMREIQVKCNPKKSLSLTFNLQVRNGFFYLEVSGDCRYFSDVERGLSKIRNRVLCARISHLRKLSTYHIINSTIIIPENGQGLNTNVSFGPYEGDQFNAQHTGIFKSVLNTRHGLQNLNWRTVEYDRYATLFLQQMRKFKDKQGKAEKGTRVWRFFGDLFCIIRIGKNYLFNIPETLHNTFETITLKQVQTNIAKLEESLGLEKQECIAQDLKNYNPRTLIEPNHDVKVMNAPLTLKPLQDVKNDSKKKKNQEIASSAKKYIKGMSHSFYPEWTHGISKIEQYAKENGFKKGYIESADHYTTISVYWRQRELVITCDEKGMIQNIKHRSTRWLSATFKRYEANGGDDVRAYLQTNALLDDDESCLETVVEYLNGRSIYAEDFMQQVNAKAVEDRDTTTFSARPLIPEMFHLNFRFRSLRRITPILKYVNDEKDILLLHEINDGLFRTETREFEWFPKHYEFEMKLNMNRTDGDLCKKSYQMSLSLFDLTKK